MITHSSESELKLSFDDSIFLISESNSTIILSARSSSTFLSIELYLVVLRSASYLNQRVLPTDFPSETIELLVTDFQDGVSELNTTICFADIDTPPYLDLNGPDLPTTNFKTIYYENSLPIQVHILYFVIFYLIVK